MNVSSAWRFAVLVLFILGNTSIANDSNQSKLFERLTDQQSGIDFTSKLIPDHKYGYLYHSGMTCSGLAAGDLNGDGFPDLMLANGPGKNAVYLQTGQGIHFKDVTSEIGNGIDGGDDWASGISFADVDNDGDLDIYVCNYEAPNKLYINNGPGDGKAIQFEEIGVEAGVAIKDASHMASFCDYDNDGDLDMFLLTNRVEYPEGTLSDLPVEFERVGKPTLLPGYDRSFHVWVVDADNWGVEPIGRADYLFRNDGVDAQGQVSFTDVTAQSGISGRGDGLSCLWWDADLDGDCDLYICNDFISPDRFFVNNGDGTFSNQIAEAMPHTCWFSMGSNFGDIDNDGDFDMLVADMSATSHYKSKVTMGAMGGMNLKRANSSTPPQYMRNSLFLNDGKLLFREGAYLAGLSSSDWTWSVKMNDFDMDGLLDVYLTNGVPREMNHSDIVITQDMLAGKHMWEFFKDGEMRKEQNRAYRNSGDFKFEDVSQDWGLDHFGASYGAVSADLDRDGDLDMVVMNLEENVSVYRNETKGHTYLTLELRGKQANRFGIGATVEITAGDKKWIRQMMPAVGYHSYDEPILHFGCGTIKNIDRISITWPGGEKQLIENVATNQRLTIEQDSKDFDNSATKPTLYSKTELVSARHIENEFNDFGLQPLLPHELSSQGPCLATSDINGDGFVDLFIGGSAGTIGQIRLGSESGEFSSGDNSAFYPHAKGEDASALFVDFDSDGDQDLLIGRGSYEFEEGSAESKNLLFANDGKGKFTEVSKTHIPDTASNSGTLAMADFDKDGDIDLFVGNRVLHAQYPLAGKSELWINNEGRFDSASKAIVEGFDELGMVTDATWADIDADGWLELIVCREWDTIAVFNNNNGKLSPVEGNGLEQFSGWWKCVETGDIDGDGDLDLLATNIGLNTKYKTNEKKPMTVFYGEFDESGKAHIVEVKREGDVCYPERGRSCSSHAMPFIADKFETYHDFGLASLSDIYGDEKLDAAHQFEANTFSHGIFTNDGKGTFSFSPLPRIAQIAPSNAARLSDLDSDGDLDIIMGQNFLRPQSETSRYDGGLGQILLNNGTGNMNPVPIQESGFVARDAVTAIDLVDANNDKKLDIVVATNNGPVTIFIRQSETQR